MYKIAVDIGGTFTDCVVMDAQGRTFIAKGSTTPDDPARGVLDVVELAGRDVGLSRRELLQQTDHFVHGCTIATNAMIERKGVKTGLLTTRGHEDAVPIGRSIVKRAGLSERDQPDQQARFPYLVRGRWLATIHSLPPNRHSLRRRRRHGIAHAQQRYST